MNTEDKKPAMTMAEAREAAHARVDEQIRDLANRHVKRKRAQLGVALTDEQSASLRDWYIQNAYLVLEDGIAEFAIRNVRDYLEDVR